MRILLSALSCNASKGSEALVGYKYAEALSQSHAVSVMASPPAEIPSGARLYPISAGSCNFNDVAASALLRFELGQLPRAWDLNRRHRFDVIHRVTPSAIGNVSVLPAIKVPFVIGPLLAAHRPPESFATCLRRAQNTARGGRFQPRRLAAGIARRLCDFLSRRRFDLGSACKILVGTQVAMDHVPGRFRSRCEPVTYAGVEHERFVPPAHRPAKDPVELLYVGRMVPYKGLELLLRALALAQRTCAFRLRVVGGGSQAYMSFCRQLVAELKLLHTVEFVPAVPRESLPALYQRADIFCFPTLCDTYGIALLEAMSCACAVVVSDVAGPREIVTDATGIKVPLREPQQYIDDYAQALVMLAKSPRLRSELGARARQQILSHHDWPAISRHLLSIYENL